MLVSISLHAQPKGTLTADMTYTFKKDEGTNASAIAYNPDANLYYTVIAGNVTYPLEIFKPNGETVYKGQAGFDARGLWWNPKEEQIEGNAIGSKGFYQLEMKADGSITGGVKKIECDQESPSANAVGDYDAKKKSIAFFTSDESTDEIMLLKISKGKGKYKSIELELPSSGADYHRTSVAYTGQKGYEYAIMNTSRRRVDYFNRKGEKTASSSVPEDAVVEDRFRFSFANDRIWLYNAETRTWTAYKAF